MIHKIVYLIAYLVLFPLETGVVVQFLLRKIKQKSYSRFVLLDIYVSGMIGVWIFFEIAAFILARVTDVYSEYINDISIIFTVLFLIEFLLIFGCLFHKWKKGSIVGKISIPKIEKKENIFMLVLAIIYIVISSLFMVVNPADDTIANVIVMKKHNMLGFFNPYLEVFLTGLQGHTKFIELFYASYSEMIGIGIVQFVEYVMSVLLLIFFFGVYVRIESILISYSLIKEKLRRWTEMLFFIYIYSLFFIRGSLVMAIPQNIWNGTTILASCLIPLCFVYGYAAVCEFENNNYKSAASWGARVIIMIPVAALMHDHGSYLIMIILLILLLVFLFKSLWKRFIIRR